MITLISIFEGLFVIVPTLSVVFVTVAKIKTMAIQIILGSNVVKYWEPIKWLLRFLFIFLFKPNKSDNERLEKAKSDFALREENFKFDPSSINLQDFQYFINGLYQAEGTAGVYFPLKNSLRVVYYFSIGQNYSPESALLFLQLKSILGVGTIKIILNSSGTVHIRYVVNNIKDIFEKILPYFKYLYGQKRLDLAKIEYISRLSSTLSQTSSTRLASELIHLVYSTNPEGQERKVSLDEKLAIFNCISEQPVNFTIEENNTLPHKLFIIGLFLGDGSLGFVFDEPKARAPKFYIKIVFNFATQTSLDYNIHLLTLVAKSMGLEPKIYKRRSSIVTLEYSGEVVYKKIIPFLEENQEWLYWRKNQFSIALAVSLIYNNNRHLTKDGYIEIINLLYSIPNQYSKPKEYWLNLLEERVWK